VARFAVHQQLTPLKVSETEYQVTLPKVGEVEAPSARRAIDIATTWSRFAMFGRSSLAHFPVVENLDAPRGEET
jgi:hypothetical protein